MHKTDLKAFAKLFETLHSMNNLCEEPELGLVNRNHLICNILKVNRKKREVKNEEKLPKCMKTFLALLLLKIKL